MWEIYKWQGRWVLVGWTCGHIQLCLDYLTDPREWMLIPISGEPDWPALCPHCYTPTIHYITTKCMKCGEIVGGEEGGGVMELVYC